MQKQPSGDSSAEPAGSSEGALEVGAGSAEARDVGTPTPALDRTSLWLPLLRRLTAAYPGWALLKNADSALLGTGDVDSLAAVRDWRGIAGEFEDWAREQGLGPVLACQHVGHGPNLVTLDPSRPLLLQLDVKERRTFRGSTLVDVGSARDLLVMDPRGFRCLRAGGQGLVKLLSNGVRKGGAGDADALRAKGVVPLLVEDPDGVRLAARAFCGPVARQVLAGVEAAVEDRWDRRAMATVEAWFAVKAASEPVGLAQRAWWQKVGRKRCPVGVVIRQQGRRLPDDARRWAAHVAESHGGIGTVGGGR